MDMVGQIYLAVAAFMLGCIVTEIRYIKRIRKLRGQLGMYDDARKHGGKSVAPVASADTAERDMWPDGDAAQSLASLQQLLINEDRKIPAARRRNADSHRVQ